MKAGSSHSTGRLAVAVVVYTAIVGGYALARAFAQAPIGVEGTITTAGAPSPGLNISITLNGTKWSAQTTTDAGGKYRLSVPTAGEYTLFIGATPVLPTRSFLVRVDRRHRRIDIPLFQDVRVVSTLPDGSSVQDVVNVWWEGPIGGAEYSTGTGFVTRSQRGELRFVGWEPGEYRVVVRGRRGGRASVTFNVPRTPDAGLAVPVTLASRAGEVRVVGPTGDPIDASVKTEGRTLEGTAGVFALDSLAPGQRIVALADGYEPRCHLLSDADWPRVNLTLRRSASSPRLLLRHARVVSGFLRSAQDPRCLIPLAAVAADVQISNVGVELSTKGIPAGPFEFVLPTAGVTASLALSEHTRAEVAIPNEADACGRTRLTASRMPTYWAW